jgi:MarR family transcriptional regulator, organic hydroperoxide resistance regulator
VARPPETPTTGFLVWRLSMKWRAAVDRAVAPHGLTHAQYSVLASLLGMSRAGQSPSQRQLADHTGLEPLYVSKLACALQAAGLIDRTADPADSRAVQLTITERGADVADQAIATVHALHDQLLAPLGGPRSPGARALGETLETLLAAPLPGNPQGEQP